LKKFAHQATLRVPFGDIDWLGHVNNARFLTYFETARAELLYKTFGGKDSGKWLNLIVARAEIDFLSPARWNDSLEVKIRPISIGRTSWVYEYEIEGQGAENEKGTKRIIAKGKTVQVSYDYERRQPAPIPDELREMLSRQIEETKD
jgi:acyl-CoA thioester hydrolase